MSASARYYECIEDTFEEVENRLEALESDPDVTVAEGVINVTFANRVVFVFWRLRGVAFTSSGARTMTIGLIRKRTVLSANFSPVSSLNMREKLSRGRELVEAF
jgi:hypothetical protein